MEREVEQFRAVGHATYAAVAVEVGAQSHVFHAHQLDGVLQVFHGIEHGGLALLAKESAVEGDVAQSAGLGQGAQLVVGQVARMVAKRTAVGVAAHDGRLADVECVVETLLGSVAQVHHDAVAVHGLDDLLSKLRHAVVGVAAARGVANVVVSVVAKRDIGDASLGEVLHVLHVVVERQSVLNGKHDALAAFPLVFIQVGRCAGDADVAVVLAHDVLNLVEDEVGILHGTAHGEGHLLRELLANLGLRQVCRHGDGALPSLGHFLKVHQDARVALVEMYALGEEHRGVAVGVERHDAAVQLLGHVEVVGLAHQPLKQWQSALQTFGVPLHAHDGAELRALDGFHDAVGGRGSDAEALSGLTDGLVVEAVDVDSIFVVDAVEL